MTPPLFAQDPDELLPIIDHDGRVTGHEKRHVIHRRGLAHMAVHALIFNYRGELLIQKRSHGKDTFPGYWDCSVGGHVDSGEDYEDALRRELREEMGLAVDCRFLRELPPAPETGNERIREYAGWTHSRPQPNPAEISDWTWIDPQRLRVEIAEGRRKNTPVLAGLLDFWLHEGRMAVEGEPARVRSLEQ